MSIQLKTQKMLWGKAADRCAICRCGLVVDATETDDESIIGDVCHIVAKKPNGPRGDFPLPPEQRDKYDNLILLCKVHHKLIDDQPNTYAVESLKDIKTSHERWVRETLQEFDPAKQRDEEVYAGYVEEWARFVDIDNWLAWSSFVLSPTPSLSIAQDERLSELRPWVLGRIWPRRYPELEASLHNFLAVLSDFYNVFHIHAKQWGEDTLMTEAFYKNRLYEQSTYNRLSNEFDFHTSLVQDLMFELTRAANYICDKVREYVFPTYRFREGVILVERGMDIDMRCHTHRVEYRGDERVTHPYPGLERFMIERTTRDVYIGEGVCPSYLPTSLGE